MGFKSLSSSCVGLSSGLLLATAIGCSAGTSKSDTGSENDGLGIDGSGGTGSGVDGDFCQKYPYEFVPQTPTVFVLVDRSGSMFENNRWTNVRDAVLPVLAELEADVRFGIGAYNSINGACTDVIEDLGTIDVNNYAAMESFYKGLSTTTPSGKVDTPTSVAVGQAVDILAASKPPGASAILLVTSDDDPDFCDDVGAECGNDGAIGAIQAAYSSGVGTFVFALDNSGIEHKDWLDFWAQAGAGEEPNWSTGLTQDQYSGAVYSACNSNSGWKSEWTAAGRTGYSPIGKYSTEGGTAQAFVSADTAAVAEEIRSKVTGLKSCIFDLEGVVVEEGKEGTGSVTVEEVAVPNDQWRMNSQSQLELLGAACDTWKKPEVTKFFAGFPCDSLTVL